VAGIGALVAAAGLIVGACASQDGTSPPPPGTPAAMAIVSGDDQTGTAGQPLANPLVVRVADVNGDPVSGVEVSWTVITGDASVGSATTMTDAEGLARTTVTLGPTGGTFTIRASVAGTTPLATTFSATAPLGDQDPASIQIAGGDNQSATVGQRLANPLTVRVRNAENIALAGIGITWTVASGGGSLGAATSTTNASGIASNTFTAGGSPATSTVTAAVTSDNRLSVSFTATATAVTGGAVTVRDNFFDPNAVTVSLGGTVTWTWQGANSHNVTWVSGGFTNSGTQAAGSHEVTFNSAGTFQYYCTIHGTPTSGMRGSVAVQ